MALTLIDPRTALILVDLQKGVVGLPLAHPVGRILHHSRLLADAFRACALPVVLVTVEIGTAAAVGLTVAGQQVASVLVDRYGWFRLPQRPVSGVRLAGVALVLVGVAAMKLL